MITRISRSYLKRYFSQWAIIFTGLIGIVGAISPLYFSLTMLFWSIVFCLIISILYIIVKYPPDYSLPKDLTLIDLDSKVTAKIHFPCNDNFFKAANQLAKASFGKDTVSMETANYWRAKNPFILTCLTEKNRFAGYFDILPLTNEFAEKMMLGEVGEKDITFKDILDKYEMQNANYIYFSGIAVIEPFSWRGCKHGSILINSAVNYFELFYDLSKVKKILTIPVSECGRVIAERLGFKLELEAGLRKDKFDLYSKEFNKDDFANLKNCLSKYDRCFDKSDYTKYGVNKIV